MAEEKKGGKRDKDGDDPEKKGGQIIPIQKLSNINYLHGTG